MLESKTLVHDAITMEEYLTTQFPNVTHADLQEIFEYTNMLTFESRNQLFPFITGYESLPVIVVTMIMYRVFGIKPFLFKVTELDKVLYNDKVFDVESFGAIEGDKKIISTSDFWKICLPIVYTKMIQVTGDDLYNRDPIFDTILYHKDHCQIFRYLMLILELSVRYNITVENWGEAYRVLLRDIMEEVERFGI